MGGLIKPAGGWNNPTAVGYVKELMTELSDRFHIEGGKFHLAGGGPGGMSAFYMALAVPERVHTLWGLPGGPREAEIEQLQRLSGIAVRMFCGENDEEWLVDLREDHRRLRSAGVNAQLTVYPNQGHYPHPLRGGGFAIMLDKARSHRPGLQRAGR